MTTTTALTPKDVAEKFGTDSKTLRRFLRKQRPDAKPGQGGRWEIDPKDLTKLRKEFTAWTKAEAERKAKLAAESKVRDNTKAAAKTEPETEPTTPTEHRAEDVVDRVANGKAEGLPKAEQAKAAHRRTRKAASEKNRQPAES